MSLPIWIVSALILAVVVSVLTGGGWSAATMRAPMEPGPRHTLAADAPADVESQTGGTSWVEEADQEDGESLSAARDFRTLETLPSARPRSTELTHPLGSERPPRLEHIG
jgi:hypothetical protein